MLGGLDRFLSSIRYALNFDKSSVLSRQIFVGLGQPNNLGRRPSLGLHSAGTVLLL